MSEAFLVSGKRSPIGKYGGALSSVRPDDLAALVIRSVIEDSGVPPEAVDEVILGNANGAGEENRNVARMAWLLNGYPDTVPGVTVNRLCASGLTAIQFATAMIKSGQADIVVAGGVESMTRAPWVTEKPAKAWSPPGRTFNTSIGTRFPNPRFAEIQPGATWPMIETAEHVAALKEISRAEADEFGARSQQRAVKAWQDGKFASEIVPVEVRSRKGETAIVSEDEGPRPGTTADSLAKLKPATKDDGVCTAGNSSSLNDGASAIIVASEAAVKKYQLKSRAKVVSFGTSGLAPEVMGLGPVEATKKALDRAGWSLDQVDAIELNEAFAPQSIACIRELGLNEDKVNAWGGAIALGHPLGSSGARIVVTLLNRLETEEEKHGLATLCVGVGQGQAITVERI